MNVDLMVAPNASPCSMSQYEVLMSLSLNN